MEPLKDLNAALRYVEDNLREEINFQDISRIAQMWESLDERNIQQLKVLSNLEPGGLIQASINFDEGRMEEKGCLDHYIGIATTQGCPEVFAELKVQTGIGQYLLALVPFPIPYRPPGDEFMLSGCLHLSTKWCLDQKFCGLILKTQLPPISIVKFGYQ